MGLKFFVFGFISKPNKQSTHPCLWPSLKNLKSRMDIKQKGIIWTLSPSFSKMGISTKSADAEYCLGNIVNPRLHL